MGRVGNNATQQETIDDSFPPPGGADRDHDLFPTSHQAPPPPPPIIQSRSKVPPTKSRPQNDREEDNDEEDLYHHYNPHDHEEAESFPPKNQDQDQEHAHAFPPINQVDQEQDHGYAHAFPPKNFYGHDQHQPQPFTPANHNVGVGTNNVPFPQHQPVHIGHPVAPLNTTAAAAQFQPNRNWNSGLFDCMNDPQNALITACFPCVTFGQIAEIVDSGNTPCGTSGMLYGLIACCIAMPCLMSCTYRTKMRGRFGLIESPAPDWVVHCFCEWCALCQEYRQLKDMNLDPSIGWQGNLAMQQQNKQYTMTPPMGQRMM